MTKSNWHNLSEDVQVEIFSFLSVKHLRKVLCLNKSINQQLDESEYFWKELFENYARIVDPGSIEKTMNDDETLSIHDKYSNRLKVLIETKKKKIDQLKFNSLIFKNRKNLQKLSSMKVGRYRFNNETEDISVQEIEKLQFD